MIFVNLIYGHFDILMSQYGQTNKSHAFQGCSKLVFWLHTARTGNPNTLRQIRAPQISMISTQIPPDILQTPPRHLQGTQDAIRRQHMPTDTARHPWTLTGAVWVFLAMCVGAYCHLLIFCIHWRWLGGVWGVSDGCLRGVWVVFMANRGARMCLGGFWVLSPCSMEPKYHFGAALKSMTFIHLLILRHQNIKMSIYKVNKNHWGMWFF